MIVSRSLYPAHAAEAAMLRRWRIDVAPHPDTFESNSDIVPLAIALPFPRICCILRLTGMSKNDRTFISDRPSIRDRAKFAAARHCRAGRGISSGQPASRDAWSAATLSPALHRSCTDGADFGRAGTHRPGTFAIAFKLADLGGVPIAGTPAQFWEIHRMETEKWAKIVQFSGAKAE